MSDFSTSVATVSSPAGLSSATTAASSKTMAACAPLRALWPTAGRSARVTTSPGASGWSWRVTDVPLTCTRPAVSHSFTRVRLTGLRASTSHASSGPGAVGVGSLDDITFSGTPSRL